MIAINTTSFKLWNLSEALTAIGGKLGIQFIELTTDGRAHAYPFLFQSDYSDLTLNLNRTRQTVVALSGGWTDFVTNQIDLVQPQVALADYLGIKKIRFFLTNPRLKLTYSSKLLATAASNLSVQANKYPHIRFMIENHGSLLSDPEMALELMHRVDAANVKLVFDPANWAASCADPIKAYTLLWPYIGHVHVKDIDHNGHFTGVGSGILPWPELIHMLKIRQFRGWYSFEHEPSGEITLEGQIAGLKQSLHNFMELL